MAPEEVDVFTIPHSRMKQLVEVSSQKIYLTDFANDAAMKSLLHSLHRTFCEFKTHEQIENKLIMKKLKTKLKALSIHDAAVCNCHNDSQLSDMLALVKDGYSCTHKSQVEKLNYGLKLQHALEEFNKEFLPHMKEEEEVFQPMLMKYFGYDELKSLKDLVLQEHIKWQDLVCDEKSDLEPEEKPKDEKETNHFEILPPEILNHIFSFLDPKSLARSSTVCRSWYTEAYSESHWPTLSPVYWAKGAWSKEEMDASMVKQSYQGITTHLSDEDADLDETESYEEWEFHNKRLVVVPLCRHKEVRMERDMLSALIQHVLPRVGHGVKKIHLANCGGLTNSQFRNIIKLCPNVEWLDVSDTDINDFAFKGLSPFVVFQKIAHFDLSGCQVSNEGLKLFAQCFKSKSDDTLTNKHGQNTHCCCFNKAMSIEKESCSSHICRSCPLDGNTCTLQSNLKHISLSGCYRITDFGLRYLLNVGLFANLKFLDLSGCWQLSGPLLKELVKGSSNLNPENLYYCSEIEDGPFEDEANGCQNLESGTRPCCRSHL